MRVRDFSRCVVGISATAALLADCGGSQPQIGAPSAMPQSQTTAARGGSWLPEATGEDLIYAVGGCGGTCVLSASGGDVVGSLNESGDAACSDDAGNVFIAQYDDVLEYAHGDTAPKEVLSLPGNLPGGCSVDPATNNLAVISGGVSIATDVAIFPSEGGTPRLYTSHIDSSFCGYDAKGNLFVDGYGGQGYALTMLAKGKSSFSALSIDQSMGQPGQLQWDGKYMTYEARATPIHVSRFTVSGSNVNVAGVTKVAGAHKHAFLSWIHGGNILVPYPNRGSEAKQLGEWNYPKGGKEVRRFYFGNYKDSLHLQAITYSAATK